MKNTIEYLAHPRAKMGWHHALKVLEHICRGEYNIPFIYYRETLELLIVDDKLIEFLEFLQIPYELRKPSQSITYIKES